MDNTKETTWKRPSWYTDENDSAWNRVKAAFGNDWEQTRRDFGSKTARDLDQDVNNTVKQAAGSDDGIENHEQAFRFGYAAQSHYRNQYPTWNADLEKSLRNDYGSNFDRDSRYIRHAYEYRPLSTAEGKAAGDESRDRL